MVYCTNGEIGTYQEIINKGNTPEAVIFYVDNDDKIDGKAYAVCIREHESWAFSDPDTTYVAQGTSADISTFDGEKNTTEMRSKEISSPLAESLDPKYFIPSVAEMYKMYLGTRNHQSGYHGMWRRSDSHRQGRLLVLDQYRMCRFRSR